MIECPWDALASSPAAFCEASLCAWIRQPGNTWTNIGFLIVAGVCYAFARREDYRHLRGVAHILVITGVGSAFFHASETAISVAGDYLGMFMASTYMLGVCLRRWTGWGAGRARVFFWTVLTAAMVLFFLFPDRSRLIYLVMGGICGISDTALLIRDHKWMRFEWYAGTWVAVLAAGVVWGLDLNGTVCNPDNHVFSGHGAWHLLNAAGMLCTFFYYRQFEVLRA